MSCLSKRCVTLRWIGHIERAPEISERRFACRVTGEVAERIFELLRSHVIFDRRFHSGGEDRPSVMLAEHIGGLFER